MRVDSSFGEHDRQGFDAVLRSILIGCQRYSRVRQEACDPDVQTGLHEDYRAYLVQLYQLLEPDLQLVVSNWLGKRASDTDALVKSMFTNIFIALPQLRIDREENLRARLLEIAVYGMSGAGLRGAVGVGEPPNVAARPETTPEAQEAVAWTGTSPCPAQEPAAAASTNVDREGSFVDSRRRIRMRRPGHLWIRPPFWRRPRSAVERIVVGLRMRARAYQDEVRDMAP